MPEVHRCATFGLSYGQAVYRIMIGSIGIDLVEVGRLKRLVERYGDRFLMRVYGAAELAALQSRHDRYQFLAGRFAAKEATIKALGKYLTTRPPYRNIQIVNDNTGQPLLRLEGDPALERLHLDSQVSISHERSHAAAVVVLREKS